jgi:hypothetical protein
VWPFHRKTEAPVDSGSRPAPAPVIRRDWSGLPPIQRLIGAHPLTAPSDRFSNDLATHHDPSVSTEPMGHQVSAEAPAGIVLALARPTTRNDGPAMISRQRVQRRVQSAIEESGEWDGDEAAPPATWPSPLPTSGPPSAVRELPVVAAAPVAQRLTTLSADMEPMPIEAAPRRSRIEPIPDWPAASRADTPDGPMPPPRLTLGQARRLGLGAPIKRVPDRSVQRATLDTTEMPLAASPPPQLSPAKMEREPPGADLGAPSPAGLGIATRLELPLATRESGPAAHPDASPPARTELSVDAPLQRAMEISAGASPASGERLDLAPVSAAAMVQRMPGASPAGALDISAEHEPAPEMVQRTPRPNPPPQGKAVGLSSSRARGEGVALAPLVGARPLRPTTLQRSTRPGGVDFQEPIGGSVDSDPTEERAAPSLQRTGFAEPLGPEPLASRDDTRPPSSNGSFGTVPTRSLLSPKVTPLSVTPLSITPQSPQARYGPTLPDRAVAVGRRLQVQAQSEPFVGRAAGLPLAPVQRAAPPAAAEPLEPGGGSTLDVGERQWPDSLSSVASSAPTQGSSPAEGSVFASHTAPETDMDELAGKLYDKIRTRLKSELLVDRERAGFLTDLR